MPDFYDYLLSIGMVGSLLFTGASQEIKVENVVGQEAPEKFYEINGKRVYLEIDGKPVEQYFRGEQK